MVARNAEVEHHLAPSVERTFMAIRFGNAVSCAKSLMSVVLLMLLYAGFGHSQADSGSPDGQPIAPAKTPAPPPPKRILGIVPNYRTSPTLEEYKPITTREKFKIATEDSFDPGTAVLAAVFGAEAGLTKSTPSFGQGPSGYARYFAASLADFTTGNYMTEAIYPSVLHQDPRYFRRGEGAVWSRMGSAASQILWTRTDTGRRQFNLSEILGNATSVAVSNAYYPDNRNASDAATKFSIQIGVDLGANILKEFSPELTALFSRKHRE
jgi:hypothetical protein